MNIASSTAIAKRVFSRVGVVISASKMPKMVKVRVPKPEWNDLLRKYKNHHEDYLVHDENSACVEGDVVRIQRSLRASKHKRHVVSEIVSPFGTGERVAIETEEEREKRLTEKRTEKLKKRTEKLKERAVAKKVGKKGKEGEVVEEGNSEVTEEAPREQVV